MAKSIRSKIKKRLRTAKRQRVDAMIVKPREAEHFEELKKVMDGRSVTLARAPNAFKYPDAPGAVFPQHEVMKPIDFRAQNLPMAGYVFRGNRRKYNAEEEAYMKNIAENLHPKMEVLAGGGAILAKTGARVPLKEAELEATKAFSPQAAAIAEAGPSRAASAVAAAVAQDEMEMNTGGAQAPIPDSDDEEASAPNSSSIAAPANGVDTSRPPLVKDTRRGQRTRARPNSVKKRTKADAKAEAKADAKAEATAAVAKAGANESQCAPGASSAAPAAAPAASPAVAAVESPAATGKKKKKGKVKKVSKAGAADEQMETD